MPYRTFGVEEVARYLHLECAEVQRLVKARDIPFERRGERLIFRKTEIDAGGSPRVLGLEGRRLADYHQNSSRQTGAFVPHEELISDFRRPPFINPSLPSKTQA